MSNVESTKWRLNNLYRIVDKEGNSIPFRLNPVQEEVLDGLHNRNLILKSRQLGMSTFAVLFILDQAIFTSNLSCGIVSYSLEHAQHIFKRIIGHALDTLTPFAKERAGVLQRSAREITFKNGSFLRVDTTLRGGAYQCVLVSEYGKTCARNPLKAEEVVTGSLQTVPTNGTIIIESTAEGSSGFYSEMITAAVQRGNDGLSALDYKLFFFPWYSDVACIQTQSNISISFEQKEYFDKLEKDYNITLSLGQRKWYCHQQSILGEKVKQEFCSTVSEAFMASNEAYYFQAAIECAYNDSRCLNTALYDALAPVYVSADIGINDLTVLVFFQIVHGEIRVIDMYQNKNQGLDHYAKHLLQEKKYIYGTIFLPHDSARRDNIIVENSYEREFRKIFAHTDTKFVVLKRTDKCINIYNAKNKFDRCVFALNRVKPLIDQLSKYRKKWSEPLGRYLDEPLHDVSCFIGETLIETDLGQKRIDKISIGDKVLTPNGLKSVLNVFKYKTNKLVRVETNETKVTCTPHHQIFSSKGLVNADTLCYTDQVITNKDINIWKNVGYLGMEKKLGFKDYFLSMNQKQLSFLMDANTLKTNLDIGLEEEKIKDSTHYIEVFGGFITEIYQKAISSITLMRTNLIIKSKILNLCPITIISPCICQQKKEYSYLDRLLKKPKKLLQNGIKVKVVENGIERMERKHSKINQCYKRFVKYVEKLISQSGKDQPCVQMRVEQKTEDFQVSTQKQERVKFAKKSLNVENIEKNARVLEVAELSLDTEIEVYDIEVEDDHCYFANGILVSNSNYADSFIYAMQAVNHLETAVSMKGALQRHKEVVDNRRFRI